MPSVYANTPDLPRYLKDRQPTQELADQVYFHLMLRTVSTCNANKASGKRSIPYVGQSVYDNPDPKYRFAMTRPVWRELLWHIWMRGADGMYFFNLGYPGSNVTAAFSFQSVEDGRAILNELLAMREFLDKGEPMNFQYPPMFATEPVWSGLRLPDRCLIRAFSPTPQTQQIKLTPFEEVSVKIDAPPAGALYIIERSGKISEAEASAPALPHPASSGTSASPRCWVEGRQRLTLVVEGEHVRARPPPRAMNAPARHPPTRSAVELRLATRRCARGLGGMPTNGASDVLLSLQPARRRGHVGRPVCIGHACPRRPIQVREEMGVSRGRRGHGTHDAATLRCRPDGLT